MTHWPEIAVLVAGAIYATWMLRMLWRAGPRTNDAPSRACAKPASTPEVAMHDHSHRLVSILELSQGGVHQRISEIRLITQSIRMRHPDLFKHEAELPGWLSATDNFLCQLRDAAWPEGSSASQDDLRRCVETHQARPDYDALSRAEF